MKIGWGLCKLAGSLACGRKLASRARGEEGAAIVEIALTTPLFLALITGAASFSMAMYYLQQVGNASSAAAMALANQAGILTDPCADVVVPMVTKSLPSLNPAKLTYTVTIYDSSGTAHASPATAGSSFKCPTLEAYMAVNEPVIVTVSYQYAWMPVFGFTASSPLTGTGSAMQM